MMNYIESSKLCVNKRNLYKTSVAIGSKDPKDSCIFVKERQNYVKKRLQKMELLAMKLECQRVICAFAVIFTIVVYFLIWYNTECWALPFQESPCMQPRDLPLISTNQSTLAEEVDEFILPLRSQITKFHDAIRMPDQIERQKLSNITKAEIGQLMHRHSEDLAAFGELKGEDDRIWDMNTAMIGTYIIMALVSMPVFVFITTIPKILAEYKLPETRNTKRSSAEESENLQNARLKQLKRQIPMINIATLICIAAEITLLSVFIAGHYYSGSSPTVLGPQTGSNTDYLNFSTNLESTLNKRFAKLDNAMGSSALELRQSIWQYESEAFETAIEHHLSLKKHNVDRRTMPRKIGNGHSKLYFVLYLLVAIGMLCLFGMAFREWAATDGSLTKRSTSDIFKRTYLKPSYRLKNKIGCKETAAIDLNNSCHDKSQDLEKSTDVKERLQKMELLAMKLECQRDICAFVVILTIVVYFLIWYNTECWALPFQESPCMQPRDLPLISTNQSTLAEEVDEFILALRSQITKFHDAIQTTDQVERHKLSNITKAEIGQLMHLHSEDLSAFGALKGEDDRIWDMDLGIFNTYCLTFISLLYICTLMAILIPNMLAQYKLPEIKKIRFVEAKNVNARLKQLKREIPMINIATLICIAAEITLLSVFIAGHYYSGSSPMAFGPQSGYNTVYLNFSTNLESTLNKRFAKLDNAMESPVLEVRQSIWQYESEAFETAIEQHLGLKKHTVDRRTMPRKIGNGLFNGYSVLYMILAIVLLCLYYKLFREWAAAEGSVWRIFKCVRIYIPKDTKKYHSKFK
ncbi:hypothetical protein Ddc_10226 [Ditylenchus destructor]|nr:hypothetical protein Ddc_10226 [Ditylenchus destructor]